MPSPLADRIAGLVIAGRSRVSDHGFRELQEDGIKLSDIPQAMTAAVVVEEYPDYHKGPAVLFLIRDRRGNSVHVLWGTSKADPETATLVTAYRPASNKWTPDFLKRIRS